ncbi:hypothetical protein RhiJN_20058 [Ceratobasidium sp. AG-Ba]|nr:hypothetical protein RhiJN_20058 [Ceratobasidium sp. AG-Ba]
MGRYRSLPGIKNLIQHGGVRTKNTPGFYRIGGLLKRGGDWNRMVCSLVSHCKPHSEIDRIFKENAKAFGTMKYLAVVQHGDLDNGVFSIYNAYYANSISVKNLANGLLLASLSRKDEKKSHFSGGSNSKWRLKRCEEPGYPGAYTIHPADFDDRYVSKRDDETIGITTIDKKTLWGVKRCEGDYPGRFTIKVWGEDASWSLNSSTRDQPVKLEPHTTAAIQTQWDFVLDESSAPNSVRAFMSRLPSVPRCFSPSQIASFSNNMVDDVGHAVGGAAVSVRGFGNRTVESVAAGWRKSRTM